MDTKKESFDWDLEYNYKDKDKDKNKNNVGDNGEDNYEEDDDDNYLDIDDEDEGAGDAIDDKFRMYRENLRRHRQIFAKYEKERREISQTLSEIIKEVRSLRSDIDELEMTVNEVMPVRQDNNNELPSEVIETADIEDNNDVEDYEYEDNDEHVASNIENITPSMQPETMQSQKKPSKISQLLDGKNKHCVLS